MPSPLRSQVGQQLEDVIARLNRFLRGWGNYFRTGNAGAKFVSLDHYVAWRLRRLLVKKRGPPPPCRIRGSLDPHLVPRPGSAQAHGHYPLPEGCVTMSRRPSVSRMRENRTYGSKGGWGNGVRTAGTAPLTTSAANGSVHRLRGRRSKWQVHPGCSPRELDRRTAHARTWRHTSWRGDPSLGA